MPPDRDLLAYAGARAALLLLLLCVSLLVPGLASAASVCSPPPGTVGTWAGERIACVADAGAFNTCARRYVADNGQWATCPDWVRDGGDPLQAQPVEDPETKPCMARQNHERWGGPQGDMCSSVPPGVPADPAKHILPFGRPGAQQRIHDGFGNAIGWQEYRCVRGEWRLLSQSCFYLVDPNAPAPQPAPAKPRAGDAKVGPQPR